MGADMAITLVTGATGLVGSHVARALLARGDHVRVTVPGAVAEALGLPGRCRGRGRRRLDRRAMRRALQDVDRLFHVRGTRLRAPGESCPANVAARAW